MFAFHSKYWIVFWNCLMCYQSISAAPFRERISQCYCASFPTVHFHFYLLFLGSTSTQVRSNSIKFKFLFNIIPLRSFCRWAIRTLLRPKHSIFLIMQQTKWKILDVSSLNFLRMTKNGRSSIQPKWFLSYNDFVNSELLLADNHSWDPVMHKKWYNFGSICAKCSARVICRSGWTFKSQ